MQWGEGNVTICLLSHSGVGPLWSWTGFEVWQDLPSYRDALQRRKELTTSILWQRLEVADNVLDIGHCDVALQSALQFLVLSPTSDVPLGGQAAQEVRVVPCRGAGCNGIADESILITAGWWISMFSFSRIVQLGLSMTVVEVPDSATTVLPAPGQANEVVELFWGGQSRPEWTVFQASLFVDPCKTLGLFCASINRKGGAICSGLIATGHCQWLQPCDWQGRISGRKPASPPVDFFGDPSAVAADHRLVACKGFPITTGEPHHIDGR